MEENPVPEPPQHPQSQTQPQTPSSHSVVTKTHSKFRLVIIIFLLILFLVPSGLFLYLKFFSSPAATPVAATPSPVASSQSPSPTPVNLKTFTSEKLKGISFSGFDISYPDTWIAKEDRSEKASTTKLTLVKGDYAIIIQQGPFDGGLCAYTDADVPQGEVPFLDKRDFPYFDLKTDVGNLRRDKEVASGSGEIGYAFCQENASESGTFGSLTSVGAISYGGPAKWTNGILEEMDSIIKSLKTL